MQRTFKQKHLAALAAAIVLTSACAATSPTASAPNASPSAAFRAENVLVIGFANNYEGRTRFERKLASDLKASGLNATALYAAADGKKPIEREAIEALIERDGYNAVLVSRALETGAAASMKDGTAATKAVRREGNAVNLFRYDYEELNEPAVIDIKLSVRIYTELFAAGSSERIWALESTISRKDSIDELINEASDKIVRQLKRDKLIGN